MDMLWDEAHPLMTDEIKLRYEKYKKKWGIGDDNMNPIYKLPDGDYPILKNKRPMTEKILKALNDYDPSKEA